MKKKSARFPGVTRVSDEMFEIRVKIINPKNGKETDLRRVVQARSMEEAATKRTALRDEMRSATQPVVRLTLATYARSWLSTKLGALKPSTARRYADALDLHILPQLGDYYLDAITSIDVQQWRDAQRAKPSTINSRLRVLRTLMRDATDEHDLARNPTERVRALAEPRHDEDPNRLTAEELGRFLGDVAANEPEWQALFTLLALTGMRVGEATALHWKDIDTERGLIQVRRAQWQGRLSTTKTGTLRTVPLCELLQTALQNHRQRMLRMQHPGLKTDLVFPSRKGGLLRNASLNKPRARVLARIGLERRQTTHGLRRTFNNLTRQVASGEVVRSMTGHVTERMTEHYSHVETTEKHAAVTKIVALAVPAAKVADQVADNVDQSKTAS